jgi:hypothetical protein
MDTPKTEYVSIKKTTLDALIDFFRIYNDSAKKLNDKIEEYDAAYRDIRETWLEQEENKS